MLRSEHWRELCGLLSNESETAAVLIVGWSLSQRPSLLVRSVVLVTDTDYVLRSPIGLTISSPGFVHPLKQARLDRSGAVFFHTHPGGSPAPSSHDRRVDEEIGDLVRERTATQTYGHVILGGTEDKPLLGGIWWSPSGVRYEVDRLRVVGSTIQVTDLRDGSDATSDVFDRQTRAFGASGQRTLRTLHAGVVGAGGTGSATCELLLRLGVGELTVIDDDVVTATNVPRLFGAGHDDIGSLKVDVVQRNARRIGLGSLVHSMASRVTSQEAARALRECDVVFGCTDDEAGRAVLSRLAYWYLIPVIDEGVVVDSDGEQIRGIFARVTYLAPGSACLVCRGRVDFARVRSELLSPLERSSLESEGYVAGLPGPTPSVVVYTSLVATLAVAELLERLFHFGAEPRPSELIALVADRKLVGNVVGAREGHFCADTSSWGRGDDQPLLGQVWLDAG